MIDENVTHATVMAAHQAVARGDWAEALSFWEAAHDAGKHSSIVAFGRASALLTLGRLDEAEFVLTEACKSFPEDAVLARTRARAAERSGNWVNAIARWRDVLHLAPADSQAHLGLATCQRAYGDLDASDATLRAATRICSVPELDIARAWTALTLRKTPASWAHWSVIRALHPENRFVQLGPHREDVNLQALARNFVSLGGNCEFGLVQRYLKLETLDLLRWSSVFPSSLVKAARARFAAIEDPTTLLIEIDQSGEYMLRDTRYGIAIHCFVKAGEVDEETFHQQQPKRIGLLRQKLLDELDNARRIAVYWQPSLTISQMESLHGAFRESFPSATLLCITVGDADETTPSVRVHDLGLLVGTIDRDGRVGARQGWSVAVDQWLAVLFDARMKATPLMSAPAS